MIFDHSECIISLFNPHNARFVVKNFEKINDETKSANTHKMWLIWHNMQGYILPFDYTFIYLWQNIACHEQNNWKKKRTG